MDNSNTTASINTSASTNNPQSNQAANQIKFVIGDIVLCPSLSSKPFALTDDPLDARNLLTLTYDGGHYYYDENGYFVSVCDEETGDYQPSLFHDTQANRQAIATLYGTTSNTQSSRRKLIDTTNADDEEVVLIKSSKLSNNAGEVHGAIDFLDDISSLLGLIYSGKVCHEEVKSLARLTQTTTETWAEILYSQLDRLNGMLALTKFSKVGE